MHQPREIMLDAVYPLAEFAKRAGLGDFCLRKLKKLRKQGQGPLMQWGDKVYIRGRDWFAFLQSQTNATPATKNTETKT